MSHRTILEFNHDYLHDMEQDPEFWKRLMQKLKANDFKDRWTPEIAGVRKVGERHHSETLNLTIR